VKRTAPTAEVCRYRGVSRKYDIKVSEIRRIGGPFITMVFVYIQTIWEHVSAQLVSVARNMKLRKQSILANFVDPSVQQYCSQLLV
jgi:hypothetical protein